MTYIVRSLQVADEQSVKRCTRAATRRCRPAAPAAPRRWTPSRPLCDAAALSRAARAAVRAAARTLHPLDLDRAPTLDSRQSAGLLRSAQRRQSQITRILRRVIFHAW